MTEEKRIEEMAEYIFGNAITHDTRFKEDCRSIARDLYTAGYRKQSEWISVEERLPEDEKAVLCYYGFDDLGMMFTGVLSYFCFDPDPHWQHADTGFTVTHWMPLPEPPKMKGGE